MTATATNSPTRFGGAEVGRARLADGAAIVGTRIALWVGLQLLVAGLIVVAAGAEEPITPLRAGGWSTARSLISRRSA